MLLLSTGKTTVLSDFANLETKSIYQHANGEATDFQFYARQPIFLEVNKKSGLEIMRIKEKKEQKMEIQRVRKLNIEKVYCVACAKQSMEEMAFGGVDGQVSLYNYSTSELVHRFKAESNRNSVLYLDYNGTDEYISSVFESGQINIYGTKTKTKIESINIDGNSSLVRFHPTKRFQLSIASFKGSVSIYDVQTKRKLFHSVDAHAAPCRDLCISPALPDTLISVGYDCVVNIFDTRRKTQPIQLSFCHPLSTVAVTNCGTNFCVGNLKGELITYDMRNTKVYLASKKVHDCAVTRIAFVPMEDYGVCSKTATSFTSNVDLAENTVPPAGVAGDLRKSMVTAAATVANAARSQRDSFCDFLDYQANKGLEKISTRFTMRRESFDWEQLTRKPSKDASMQQSANAQISIGSVNHSAVSSVNSASTSRDDKFNESDFVNTKPRGRSQRVEEAKTHFSVASTLPLRDRSNTPKNSANLKQIKEEDHNQPNAQAFNLTFESDKENPQVDLELSNRLQSLPANCNSTPNRAHSLDALIPSASSQKQHNVNLAGNLNDITSQIQDLRLEMNERFRQLEFEMKFQSESNKWQIFTQTANLWSKQYDNTEEIRDALGILLQTDPFVNEFLRLKEENEVLKQLLLQQSKK